MVLISWNSNTVLFRILNWSYSSETRPKKLLWVSQPDQEPNQLYQCRIFFASFCLQHNSFNIRRRTSDRTATRPTAEICLGSAPYFILTTVPCFVLSVTPLRSLVS